MVDFISEVEEELRKDDYNKFLRKYGPLIVGLLIGVVAVVAFLEYRDYRVERTARAAATSYLEADTLLQDGQPAQARAAFLALADVAPDGYAGLSLMRAAIIADSEGNPGEAVRLYDLAADRLDIDRHSDLARLKAAYVLANQEQWSDVRQRADRIAGEGAPYEYLARELVATADLNTDNTDEARRGFRYLATVPGVPATVARRAEQAVTLMDTQARAMLPAPDDATPAPDAPDTPSGD